MKEVWKKIKNHPKYKVSNLGRIKSFKRKENGEVLKGTIYSNGYRMICLDNERYPIHRLVMIAFKRNPKNKPQVNHKNGIKDDNKLENLEWCTPSENAQHAYDTKLRIGNFGTKNAYSKLTEKQAMCIFKDKTKPNEKIAKKYNVSRRTIDRIKRKDIWRHIHEN